MTLSGREIEGIGRATKRLGTRFFLERERGAPEDQ
jgi:hypothetical protein